MPLSTVLGAQSLVQPAVCTTATRPASPYTGQAIYDTTISALLIWSGTAWTGTGGLVYLTGTTFSAASTVSLPASTFSSTYSNYKIMFDITAASTNATALNARLRISATDNSASNYYNSGIGSVTSANTVVYARADFASAFLFGYLISTDANPLTVDVMQPFSSTVATKVAFSHFGRDAGGSVAGHTGGGGHNTTTSFDAFTIYPAAGTITGSYKVYGYANS